jgi:hypothetical protein
MKKGERKKNFQGLVAEVFQNLDSGITAPYSPISGYRHLYAAVPTFEINYFGSVLFFHEK